MFALSTAFVAIFLFNFASAQIDNETMVARNTIFYGFSGNSLSSMFILSFNKTLSEQGCDPNGKFAIIVHGWKEGYKLGTYWVNTTILNLLKHRGGCVFFMDYSKYANTEYYFERLVPHFKQLSAVLLKMFKYIGNYGNQYCFGFSFGSWLCSETGKDVGNQLIERMDLCDPAGWGFDKNIDPKPAAKNVACINTSTDKGTNVYNCHQNFRMGSCGNWQLCAGSYPKGSHGICPELYNLAFDIKFTPVNYYKCGEGRLAKNLTSNVTMGYNGNFNRTLVRGDIFIATARYPNYIVVNNVVENKKP